MSKIIIVILFILIFTNTSFSQDFKYSFRNLAISEYLNKNPEEYAFNSTFCISIEDENDFNCSDNFGVIRWENIGDSLNRLTYKNGNTASEIREKGNSRIIKTFFHDTAMVFSVEEYKEGKFWNVTFYNKSEKKLDRGNFKNGTGQLKFYRQNCTLSAIMNLVNGELNGKITLFYSDGNKMLEGAYQNGNETCEWKEYPPKF